MRKLYLIILLLQFGFVILFAEHNNRLGVHLLYCDPGDNLGRVEQVISKAKGIKAGWVRVGFIWAIANPYEGKYDFEFYDWFFKRLKEEGLSILVSFAFTPRWCSSFEDSEEYYLYPPTADEITEGRNGYFYLYEIAKKISERYKNIVNYWEFWNEPDMEYFLKDSNGNGTSADEYSKMLAFFYKGIKDGNGRAKVLIGGLAQGFYEHSCDNDYLMKLYTDKKYPALKYYDIHNIHTNFKSLKDIKRQIELNKNIMRKFNSLKEIWITETSYSPVARFQNLENYKGGENGFNQYVFDSLVFELLNIKGVVFWTPLNDYNYDYPEDNPYKYNGLFSFNLKGKEASRIFKIISLFFKRKLSFF